VLHSFSGILLKLKTPKIGDLSVCAACVEYTKDRLTTNEFKSALAETTREDRDHREEVERIIQENSEKPDELKQKIKDLGK
jgi:hypothetical protein